MNMLKCIAFIAIFTQSLHKTYGLSKYIYNITQCICKNNSLVKYHYL